MFKKGKKTSKRATVYRPHVLDDGGLAAGDHHVRKRATLPSALEDLLVVGVLVLTTVLMIELGQVSAQASPPQLLRPTVEQSSVQYGRSAGSRLLVGTSKLPLPLFAYAATPKKPAVKPIKPVAAAVVPKKLGSATCGTQTIMNVVAHEDDDLLFINPSVAHAINQHDCIRTVYVTAGDDGRGVYYLHLREAGAEAAYDTMLGNMQPWDYQQLVLPSGAVVTSASPQGDPGVSLIFLRLPDGNLSGRGFEATGHESLARLLARDIPTVTSVDGIANYTSDELTTTLAALMELYTPDQINTQADDSGRPVAEHSDHIAAGRYATLAAIQYATQDHLPVSQLVRYYMGYPIRSLDSNLSLADTAEKSAAFFAYAVDDPGVCTSMIICHDTNSTYGLYLSRQYTILANQ